MCGVTPRIMNPPESGQETNRQHTNRIYAHNEDERNARLENLQEYDEEKDVIVGRGKGVQNNTGFTRYRRLILDRARRYGAAKAHEKRGIADKIIEAFKPGRFFKPHENDGLVVISEVEAQKKVMQALRDVSSKQKKPIFHHYAVQQTRTRAASLFSDQSQYIFGRMKFDHNFQNDQDSVRHCIYRAASPNFFYGHEPCADHSDQQSVDDSWTDSCSNQIHDDLEVDAVVDAQFDDAEDDETDPSTSVFHLTRRAGLI